VKITFLVYSITKWTNRNACHWRLQDLP